MTVLHAALYGLTSALRQKRVVGILYLANLIFGLILVAPLVPALHHDLGHSLAAEGAESLLDVAILADFLRNGAAGLAIYRQAATGWFLLFLVTGTFLAGGVLEKLVRPRGESFAGPFFAGCGGFFFRFLRLLGFHLAFLVLIAAVNLGVSWVLRWFFEDTGREITATVFLGIKQLGILFLLLATAALFDFARILTVLRDRGNMAGTVVAGAGFVLRNLNAVLLIRMVTIGAGAVLVLLYWAIQSWILPDAAWLSLLVLQQLLVLSLQFLRVFRYAAELNLFRGREVSEDAQLLARITSPEAMEGVLR